MNDRQLGEYLKQHSWIAGRSFLSVILGTPKTFWVTFHCRPKSESRLHALKFAVLFGLWYVELAWKK